MDYLDEIAREQRNQIEAVEKSFDPFHISPEDIEKGRKAQLGEIRHWKDGDYKMTVNGWEYVKGSDPNIKSKKKSEEPLLKRGDFVKLNNVEGTLNERLLKINPSLKETELPSLNTGLKVIRYGSERTFLELPNGDEIVIDNKYLTKTPEKKEETVPAFKVGDTVQITDEALGLTSLMHLKGKDLKVLGTEKGTLSQPVFFRVGDGKEGGKWDVVIPPTYLRAESVSSPKEDPAIPYLKAAVDGSLKKLKATKDTAIIAATNSYKHSEETLQQINEKISALSTLKVDYENFKERFRKSSTEEAWQEYDSARKKQRDVESAIISWKIVKSASELIIHEKLNKMMDGDRTILANARTLIYSAQNFEKKVLGGE